MMIPFSQCRFSLQRVAVILLILLPFVRMDRVSHPKSTHQQQTIESNEYAKLRLRRVDEVGHTEESAVLRNYLLRNRKQRWGREITMSEALFPNGSPEQYQNNEEIPVYSDKVSSTKTMIPFHFRDLPFCLTARGRSRRINIGARLEGYDTEQAPFVIRVKENLGCTPICQVSMSVKNVRFLRILVNRQYRVHLSLDGLPLLMRSRELNYAVHGYPIGFKAPPSYTGLRHDEFYLYNHVKFTVTYHEDSTEFEGSRVIGFDVHPVSIMHKLDPNSQSGKVLTCHEGSDVQNVPENYLPLRLGPTGEPMEALFSYELEWVQSDLLWSDRWDVYLLNKNPDGDYFSLLSFLVMVLILVGCFSAKLIHTLREDVAAYKKALGTGWTVLGGEVFRPPRFCPMFLSALVGTGSQIGLAALLTLTCAVCQLFNPVKMGSMLTAAICFFALSGVMGGYVSGRFYKVFEGRAWKQTFQVTSMALPGMLMLAILALNFILWLAGATTTLSVSTILCLFVMWLLVLKLLALAGYYLGFKYSESITVPCETNRVARPIPDQPWYCEPPGSCLLSGIPSFLSIYGSLPHIMAGLWLNEIYYETGYLLAKLAVLIIVCAQVSISMCYVQLRHENHRWWWNSFFNGASCGMYLFLYSLWFMNTMLDLPTTLAVMIFMTYMGMISICLGLFCGAIGVISCFLFNRIIYGYAEAASPSGTEPHNEPLL